MQAELKVVNGEIFGRPVENDGMMRLPTKIRSDFAGNPVSIAQWIDMKGMCSWIVLNRIATSMMISDYMVEDRSSEVFWDNEEDDEGNFPEASPIWVVYEKPVILHIPSLTNSYVRMINREGWVLAGTNIYDDGFTHPWAICIGDTFDPIGPNVVELLLSNQANKDLYWRGEALCGSFQDDLTFLIKTWPTTAYHQTTPPQQVLEDFDAWSQA
jgi:hypothetical protein